MFLKGKKNWFTNYKAILFLHCAAVATLKAGRRFGVCRRCHATFSASKAACLWGQLEVLADFNSDLKTFPRVESRSISCSLYFQSLQTNIGRRE